MVFLRKDEVKNYTGKDPFVIFTDTSYYGVFIKRNGKIKNLGKLASLHASCLPKEFRRNFKLIENVIEFKRVKDAEFIYLKTYMDGNKIWFEGILLKRVISKFLYYKEISPKIKDMFITFSVKDIVNKGLTSLVIDVIPSELRNILNLVKVLYIESIGDSSIIPFEFILSDFDMLVKRIINVNSVSLTTNYFRNVLLIGNGWDKEFRMCVSEVNEIFETIKGRFSVEMVCDEIKIEELLKLLQDKDIVFISSHADSKGISIGKDRINTDYIKLTSTSPKLVFLNNCYFEGIEDMVKEVLSKGAKMVIYSPFKVPDSYNTKLFTTTFFESFSKTYDLDLSLFIAIQNSKIKGHYNHLLYKYCI